MCLRGSHVRAIPSYLAGSVFWGLGEKSKDNSKSPSPALNPESREHLSRLSQIQITAEGPRTPTVSFPTRKLGKGQWEPEVAINLEEDLLSDRPRAPPSTP